MNWKTVRDDVEDIEFQRCSVGPYDLDVMELEDGRWLFQVESDCITREEWLEEFYLFEDQAKTAARIWIIEKISEMLKAAGDGTWLVRGATGAMLVYAADGAPLSMVLERPHELVLLARFEGGDGKEPGIEYL